MTTTSQPSSPPAQAPPRRARLFSWPMLVGIVVTAALLLASVCVGQYSILSTADGWDMFFVTRVPRTATLVLAGAVMAMSGLVMQMITQNRFVEPTTTGTTEWAGLGLLAVMVIFPHAGLLAKMLGAIAAAFFGTLVFFAFIRRVRLKSSIIVPIVGMMLGAVVGSIANFVALATDMTQVLGIWFAGSFSSVLKGQYEPVWVIVAIVVIIFVAADRFTVAGLGRDIATNVGLNYDRVVLLGTGIIALATGIITVVVGNLPFLGLIVPNIVSIFRGDDLRSNLPWVALSGIALVTVCDLIGRTVIAPFEIQVSLILGILGAAVFIFLLVRGRKVVG